MGNMRLIPAVVLLVPFLLPAQPVALEFDRERSHIVARTGKGGFLTVFGAGHRHAIEATEWRADACWDSSDPARSRVAIVIPTSSLRVDTAEARRHAQLDRESGPGAEDVLKIQQQMLGPKNLDAAQHPTIAFESTSLEQRGGQYLLRGRMTLHGRTRTEEAPLAITRTGDAIRVTASFSIKQTDYAIKPTSIGGLVDVKDQVDILLDLYGKAEGACKPPLTARTARRSGPPS